ncbi:hypothetical protein GCM10027449_16600 [Sinomonas notoginsengisoli]
MRVEKGSPLLVGARRSPGTGTTVSIACTRLTVGVARPVRQRGVEQNAHKGKNELIGGNAAKRDRASGRSVASVAQTTWPSPHSPWPRAQQTKESPWLPPRRPSSN